MYRWRNILLVTLLAASAMSVFSAEVATSQNSVVQPDESAAKVLSQQPGSDSSNTVPAAQSIHAGKSKDQLLAELKDIYSPAVPAWWPPAPGWWVFLIVLLTGLAVLIRFVRKKRQFKKENNWKKSAILLHQQLCDQARDDNVPSTSVIAGASVLMRRVSLALQPREKTASLTDDQWLAVLDGIGHTREYSQGAGQLLTRHPYMRPQDIDRGELDALLKLIKNTIDHAPNRLIKHDTDRRHSGISVGESGVV